MKTAPGAIAAIALTALLAGCSSQPRAVAPTDSTKTPSSTNPFSDVFPENQIGLEVQWWTITDRGDAIARALAPYANEPTPLPASVRENWRRNGLRMVRVPALEMDAVLASLPIEDKINRMWLGQTPSWTIAAPGAPWGGERSLLIDGETIRLGAGQLRLLVRAWISPTEQAPVLRTDLALQYLDRQVSASKQSPLAHARLRRPEREGMIFRTLSAPMELVDGYAYCIVSEDPDVQWEMVGDDSGVRGGDAPARESVEPTLPERALSPSTEYAESAFADDAQTLGPEPPGIPLLADALLSRVELLPTRRRSRTIVILSAVLPEDYRLSPAAPINTSR